MGVSVQNRTGVHRLTDKQVRAFAARSGGIADKKKLFDGGGLFLTHTKAGTATWRIKYRYGRVERVYSVGPYPRITLAAARAERDMVKALLREGPELQ